MVLPAMERLRSYYLSVGRVLVEQSGAASVFPNTTDNGMSRERAYSRFLNEHLPSTCHTFLGGYVFNSDGLESRQMDIIVAAGSAIQFPFLSSDAGGKSFALIESSVGVCSIKANLNSKELIDSLHLFTTLPPKAAVHADPRFGADEGLDWPFKIVYAAQGISSKIAISKLQDYYERNRVPHCLRPNVIHIGGKYAIIRAGPERERLKDGGWAEENAWVVRDGLDVDAYALFYCVSKIHGIALAALTAAHGYQMLLRGMGFDY